MDRRRGVPATQDERLRVETITNRVEEPAPVVLGKRHAATSPVGLDEVLGLGVGDDAGAKRSTKSEVDIKSRRQRKQRKSTHAVRKEEKERLVKEMEELNAQLNKLHRPHFSMGLKEWYELRDRMDLFGKTMQRTLSEDLHFDRGVPRE
ncbi:hypothetical protein KRP22_007275 [Phytophthora ramorum]|nr:hypothetical protein KRP22_4715 [Phytophthora ramorum]